MCLYVFYDFNKLLLIFINFEALKPLLGIFGLGSWAWLGLGNWAPEAGGTIGRRWGNLGGRVTLQGY